MSWRSKEHLGSNSNLTDNEHLSILDPFLQLPLVESELKKNAPPETEEGKTEDVPSTPAKQERPQGARLVTSDGTYATQSAFSMQQTVKQASYLNVKVYLNKIKKRTCILFTGKYPCVEKVAD